MGSRSRRVERMEGWGEMGEWKDGRMEESNLCLLLGTLASEEDP